MNEYIILAELLLLVVFYALIMHTYGKIYNAYVTRQNKPEVLSSDDDINIVEVSKQK